MSELETRLFKKVFNNKVLFKIIYEFVKLYKKNECVKFNSRDELLEYGEREYIQKIIYLGNGCSAKEKDILILGDLPIGCELKEVVFTCGLLSLIKGDAIPNGVEILEFSAQHSTCETPYLSTFPSSVHTVKGISIFSVGDDSEELGYKEYYIPPNITSLSFIDCPNIISTGNNLNKGLVIPNTVKSLKFAWHWDNESRPLKIGDLPNGLTRLSIDGISTSSINGKGIIPNTIKELCISYPSTANDLFDILPSTNLETLYLYCTGDITPSSNLTKFKSLNKLFIHHNGSSKTEPNSLPPNIKDLYILEIITPIQKNLIPISVTNLKLHYYERKFASELVIPNNVLSLSLNVIIDKEGILPQSLTDLTIFNNENSKYTIESVNKMVSILPTSVTSITLPTELKSANINFHSTIKNIKYLDINPIPTQ